MMTMFKAQSFMTACFFANMYNGFSGWALFFGTYHITYNVLLTTIAIGFYLPLDCDVSFNPSKVYK